MIEALSDEARARLGDLNDELKGAKSALIRNPLGSNSALLAMFDVLASNLMVATARAEVAEARADAVEEILEQFMEMVETR